MFSWNPSKPWCCDVLLKPLDTMVLWYSPQTPQHHCDEVFSSNPSTPLWWDVFLKPLNTPWNPWTPETSHLNPSPFENPHIPLKHFTPWNPSLPPETPSLPSETPETPWNPSLNRRRVPSQVVIYGGNIRSQLKTYFAKNGRQFFEWNNLVAGVHLGWIFSCSRFSVFRLGGWKLLIFFSVFRGFREYLGRVWVFYWVFRNFRFYFIYIKIGNTDYFYCF